MVVLLGRRFSGWEKTFALLGMAPGTCSSSIQEKCQTLTLAENAAMLDIDRADERGGTSCG